MTEDGAKDKISLMLYRIDWQEKELKELKELIVQLENISSDRTRERDQQEKKQLLTGLSFLGAVILALLGVIWSYRSVIFRDSL